jgi:hypothetical protein
VAGPRTIVIGDVHGCREELEELLQATGPGPGDRLVFLGDLLDRGPDPVGVLQRVRALGAECVLGNHEQKHLRYAAHEARRSSDPRYRNPMRPFDPKRAAEHAALTHEDLLWLASLPRWIPLGPGSARPERSLAGRRGAVDGWVAVHGGLVPGVPLSAQPPDWAVKLRYVDAQGRPATREAGDAGVPGVRRWAEAWTGPDSVVYGHFPAGGLEPRRDEPRPGVVCMGIDTGCVYGGALTALVLPSGDVVQVPSRQRRTRPQEPED